jgi:hypothetical protein
VAAFAGPETRHGSAVYVTQNIFDTTSIFLDTVS